VVGFKFKRGFKIFWKMALENWKKEKEKEILFYSAFWPSLAERSVLGRAQPLAQLA
jgi:hypothetical protein